MAEISFPYLGPPKLTSVEALHPFTLEQGYMLLEFTILGWGRASWTVESNPKLPVLKQSSWFMGKLVGVDFLWRKQNPRWYIRFLDFRGYLPESQTWRFGSSSEAQGVVKRIIVPVGSTVHFQFKNLFGSTQYHYATQSTLPISPTLSDSYSQNLGYLKHDIQTQSIRLRALSKNIHDYLTKAVQIWVPKIHVRSSKLKNDLRFLDRSLDTYRDVKVVGFKSLKKFRSSRDLYKTYQIDTAEIQKDLMRYDSLASIAKMPRDPNA